MVRVPSFTFIPIHTFIPSKQGLGFDTFGFNDTQDSQRYIALEDASNSNYTSNTASPTSLPPQSLNPISVTPPNPGIVNRRPTIPSITI